MRSDQAKTIAISEYLEYVEGIKPDKVRLQGGELWYKSPIRQGDSTPSFKVDTILNLWYDHGTARGGKVIDLVCEIRQVSVREALAILDRSGLYRGGFAAGKKPALKTQQDSALFSASYGDEKKVSDQKSPLAGEKEKNTDSAVAVGLQPDRSNHSPILLDVKPITHPALIEYLKVRQIDWHIAQEYLQEIHFKPADKLVQYYALGWKSGEGYEARNKYFKGFIGQGKAISVLNPKHGNELIVFEGFMDFLSYLTYLYREKGITSVEKTVIVLNSTALKKQLLPLMDEYLFSKVYFFLDNDEAGKAALDFYEATLGDTDKQDMSSLYAGHKDMNAMLFQKYAQDE
jgi:hypothetical protein